MHHAHPFSHSKLWLYRRAWISSWSQWWHTISHSTSTRAIQGPVLGWIVKSSSPFSIRNISSSPMDHEMLLMLLTTTNSGSFVGLIWLKSWKIQKLNPNRMMMMNRQQHTSANNRFLWIHIITTIPKIGKQPLVNIHSLRHWKWPFRNSWFSHEKDGDFPVLYVTLPEGKG